MPYLMVVTLTIQLTMLHMNKARRIQDVLEEASRERTKRTKLGRHRERDSYIYIVSKIRLGLQQHKVRSHMMEP